MIPSNRRSFELISIQELSGPNVRKKNLDEGLEFSKMLRAGNLNWGRSYLITTITIAYLSQSAHKLPQWSQRIIARVSPSSWLSQVGLEAVASPFHSPDERLSTWSLSNTQSEARLSHRTGSLRHSEGSLWGQTKVFE